MAECCGATGAREGAIGAAFCADAAAVSLAGSVVLEPVFFPVFSS